MDEQDHPIHNVRKALRRSNIKATYTERLNGHWLLLNKMRGVDRYRVEIYIRKANPRVLAISTHDPERDAHGDPHIIRLDDKYLIMKVLDIRKQCMKGASSAGARLQTNAV